MYAQIYRDISYRDARIREKIYPGQISILPMTNGRQTFQANKLALHLEKEMQETKPKEEEKKKPGIPSVFDSYHKKP
jgi:hypothetical protein